MLAFIRLQYQMGNLTDDQVRGYAPRWITAEQADGIIGATTVQEEE